MSTRMFADLLRMLARTFYEDVTAVVLDYILNLGKVEEHKMAEDMNLPFKQVRQALLELGEHELLVYQEGKRERRHEEQSGNMFTRGPDASRMVFWAFNRDIIAVVKCRIYELKRMLKDVIDQAKHVRFQCPNCSKEYLDEEAMPYFQCHICSGVKLRQKHSNIDEATRIYEAAMDEIKHIDNQLNECEDVSLPASFFGDHEPLHEAAMSSKRQTTRPSVSTTLNASTLKVDVNITNEAPVQQDDISQVDPALVKYYRKLERPRKKKKTESGQNCYSLVTCEGRELPLQELTAQDQLRMSREEYQDFFNKHVKKLAFL